MGVFLPFLLLALAEFVLWILGVGSPPPLWIEKDVQGRAFLQMNPQIADRFFQIGPGGVVRPANFQVLPAEKPSGTKRILCLGESTTAGMPFPAHGAFPALLELILNERAPDTHWEVTNLGVTALSSSSVASFIDEALEVEPDALVFYMGHNEFYGVGGVVSGGARGWAILDPVYRLRTYRVLEKLIPVEWRPDLAETRERALVPPGSDLRERAYDKFRDHMEHILEAASRVGAEVILCELIANERDLYPLGSPDSPADRNGPVWAAASTWTHGRADSAQALHLLPELDRAILADSLDAGLRYLRGCARAALGAPSATADFIAARNLDAVPFRAPDRINEEIRDLAAGYSCALVPMESIFRRAVGGAIGHESCVEHLHPTFLGTARIASAAADALLGRQSFSELTPSAAGRLLRAAALTPIDLALADSVTTKLLDVWPYLRLGDKAAPYPYETRSVMEEAAELFAAAGDTLGVQAVQTAGDAVREMVHAVEEKRINILDAHKRYAELEAQEGNLRSAVWELEAGVRLFPVDFTLWVQLGRARLAMGDAEGAVAAARSSLYWAPGFPPAEQLLRDASALHSQTAP